MPNPPSADDWLDPEWADWYGLTPMERFEESQRLLEFFLLMGAPNPILKVLSTGSCRQVRYRPTASQACA